MTSMQDSMDTFESGGLGRNFTLILNKALRDKRLSWRAKGILAGCLSHNQSFKFTRSWIIEHGTEGRDAVLSALSELRELGYLKNIKTRNPAGQVVGERYVFTDKPVDPPTEEQATGVLENRTPENQRPEKPDAGKPGRNRRPVERRPVEEKEPPIAPRQQAQRQPVVDLPEWLEPHRAPLTAWLENRRKKHKLPPELTKLSSLTMRALEYARDIGVLQIYCEYVSERNWQSLGFAGYKEVIDKLAKENGIKSKPAMAPIVYTLN